MPRPVVSACSPARHWPSARMAGGQAPRTSHGPAPTRLHSLPCMVRRAGCSICGSGPPTSRTVSATGGSTSPRDHYHTTPCATQLSCSRRGVWRPRNGSSQRPGRGRAACCSTTARLWRSTFPGSIRGSRGYWPRTSRATRVRGSATTLNSLRSCSTRPARWSPTTTPSQPIALARGTSARRRSVSPWTPRYVSSTARLPPDVPGANRYRQTPSSPIAPKFSSRGSPTPRPTEARGATFAPSTAPVQTCSASYRTYPGRTRRVP